MSEQPQVSIEIPAARESPEEAEPKIQQSRVLLLRASQEDHEGLATHVARHHPDLTVETWIRKAIEVAKAADEAGGPQ